MILLCKRISERKITRTDCCILTMLINLATGLAVDAKRKRTTENANEEPLSYETVSTSENDAEAQLEQNTIQNCYDRYMGILSELDRNILIDKFISGLTTNAIKEKYSLPSTEDVRQRICRARKAIIERFGEEWRKM